MTGCAVVNGIRLPVTEVNLREGQVVFRCTLKGPVEAVDGGTVTIFGEDGTGICQGYCNDIHWKKIHWWDMLTVSISLRMETCYGNAERQVAESR